MKRLSIALIASIAFAAVGCDEDSTSSTEPATATMRIHFDHEASGTTRGATALEFDELLYTNDAGNNYSVKVLQYVVSNVTLHTADWSITYDMAHLRDGREADTRTVVLTDVPAATYEGISFTFGLDAEKNLDPTQGGDLPQTPDWEAMRWPGTWGGGYHYMKLEGDVDDEGTVVSYRTHTGKRQAQDDPTFGTDPEPFHHFFDVSTSDDFTVVGGERWDATFLMDVNAWYETNTLGTYDITNYLGGMMMNTGAQNILEMNGPSIFRLGEVVETTETQ